MDYATKQRTENDDMLPEYIGQSLFSRHAGQSLFSRYAGQSLFSIR